MDSNIAREVAAFRQIFLVEGIPRMLRRNETAFLSFLCILAATDALSGWRYWNDLSTGDACPACGRRRARDGGARFRRFVRDYFPPEYRDHARNLYLLRCRSLHNFTPAYFTLTHNRRKLHLTRSKIGDTILNDRDFFEGMKAAAKKFFGELRRTPELQDTMLARLKDTERGGMIFLG